MKPHALPRLSADSLRVLRGHRPGVPAYLSWAPGPARTAADLVAVDAAYAELVAGGLVRPSDEPMRVLPGESRHPFVLTAAGDRRRRASPGPH